MTGEPRVRTALVTGVGREGGIGAAIARRLARDGWNLALSHWSPYDERVGLPHGSDDAERLADDLRRTGVEVVLVSGDLAEDAEPARLFAAARAALGEVSGLVLSHCESVNSGLLEATPESFDRHFRVNTRASWLLIRELAGQVTGPGGRIVAMTSDAVVNNVPYGVSKAGLDRLVVAAAHELGHLGITANAINPGPTDNGWMDDATRAALVEAQPNGRIGSPEDAANLVAFLLSDEGGWINGQVLHSDGGFSSR
ncbi:MAG TPA: SDR family oxidoreductase [Nocardioidaceae bacterium]|nr:SDR family oxidoreductase [Nocardioidaceae bacterium]